MNAVDTTCDECGAHESHSVFCSRQSRAELLLQLKTYYDAWANHHAKNEIVIKRYRAEIVHWQGKHAMLRHENNKLRKKLFPGK